MMVSIRKFWIIVLVSNQIEYWSNYSIRNFEYLHNTSYAVFFINPTKFFERGNLIVKKIFFKNIMYTHMHMHS